MTPAPNDCCFIFPTGCVHSFFEVGAKHYELPPIIKVEFAGPLVVLDIGANVGAFSIWARLKWQNSTIHAYEPNPHMFRYLEHNVGRLRQAHVRECAIGDSRLDHLYLGAETPLCSSLYKEKHQGEASINVQVLQPELLPNADLVKIDTEGSEVYIVEHMTFTPTVMFIEWHGQDRMVQLQNLLRGKMTVVDNMVLSPDNGILKLVKL